MFPHRGGSVHVTVVAAATDLGERAVDALITESDVTVTTADTVSAAIDAVQAGETDCLVCAGDFSCYEQVRDADLSVPILVVAEADARATLGRVVGDDYADHLPADASLETVLPVRLNVLFESTTSETAWQLADFSDEAVVEFGLTTHDLLEANETFFDTWGWDRDRLEAATLADLRTTDITHEFRGQGRGQEGEEDLEWIRDEDPIDSLVQRAMGGLYEVREWHCTDATDQSFKTDVKVVADESDRRGYLVATVPDQHSRGDGDASEASMLRSLMEHVPMSVYFKDTESRHVLVSTDVAEPFIESPDGKILHTPEDVHGKTDFDLYGPDAASETIEEDRTVVESGHPIVDKIERFQPPQGRPLYFQTTKAPWYGDDGRVHGLIGVTVDITDQKRRENELDRQNERLDEFASIVSHDLRNPLNVARGRLDLYRKTGDESELETVAEMHDRMEGLIEDVLAFARDGNRVQDPEWLNGAAHAEQAWAGVDTTDATLTQDWAYRIKGDPTRLIRLFENLFRNAVEHVGDDVAMSVGTLSDVSGFYVEDDGPGIPEDERDEIFDRGMTTNPDGTGFGLAIVREIAEAHGWEISVTDGTDGGARFEIRGVPRGSEPGSK